MRALTRREFLRSPAGIQAKRDLQHMVNSSVYKTDQRHNLQISRTSKFVERHITYLVEHPQVSPAAYLSNLRIMLKAGR
jgi:hypothetical protein